MSQQTKIIRQEKILLARISRGDQRAFEELFKMHQSFIYSLSFRLTRSRFYSQEIVQDVFLKIWVKRKELHTIENFSAYLNRITRNLSIDALRIIARETLKRLELEEQQPGLKDYTTEETISYHESAEMLNAAVETLSMQQKKVYRLCYEQGLKYEETAQQLGIAVGTVQAHMKQALKNIRLYIKKLDMMLMLF